MDYKNLSEITVHNQEELNDIPLDFKGRIYIECTATVKVTNRYYWSVEARGNSSVEAWENSSVVAWENSSVVAWGNSSVVAWGNSSVEAWGNSSVEAWGNSSVEARGNSSVEAWGNSFVEAWENSSVEARGNSSVVAWGNSSVVAWENSSVEAWGNSSVEAWENSSVEAWGNSSVEAWENSSVEAWENSSVVANANVQVVDRQINGKIQLSGNARKVFVPKNIFEFMDFYGIKHDKKKSTFYKAVHKSADGIYYSDHNNDFTYTIGETITETCCIDTNIYCSEGIHVSHLAWALSFGRGWNNLAIIEIETDINKIVMPKCADGKVRTSEVKVIREVPLEECGLYGKIIAKRRAK